MEKLTHGINNLQETNTTKSCRQQLMISSVLSTASSSYCYGNAKMACRNLELWLVHLLTYTDEM